MSKIAVIMIRLVDESADKANGDIEREIFEELSKGLPSIPWFQRIEKVTVRR